MALGPRRAALARGVAGRSRCDPVGQTRTGERDLDRRVRPGLGLPPRPHDDPVRLRRGDRDLIPHNQTFSTIIQPPYSSTKG
jgi:hypothetical protein